MCWMCSRLTIKQVYVLLSFLYIYLLYVVCELFAVFGVGTYLEGSFQRKYRGHMCMSGMAVSAKCEVDQSRLKHARDLFTDEN